MHAACGSSPDLEGWTAQATLFWRDWMQASICSEEEVIPLDSVANAMVGDSCRIEDPDARETVVITSVDRVAQVVRVTRGDSPRSHAQDTPFYGIRASGIPVEIVQETTPWNNDPDVVVVDSNAPEYTTVRTLLRVRWRQSDTIMSGSYYVEIQLCGPDGEKLTFPRDSIGYPVRIALDSNDL
ncbi:MAG: hypothetical protein LLG08_08930 [Actinomycetia bacterium]|nr:hypothetical protein [Actinomycetes bacterium]